MNVRLNRGVLIGCRLSPYTLGSIRRTLCAVMAAAAATAAAGLAFSPRVPLQDPAARAHIADGVYLYFDSSGVLPSAELLANLARLDESLVHVVAVTEDPEKLLAPDASLGESLALLEVDGECVPYSPFDPSAPDLLESLGVRSLPVLVVVKDGRFHVREGGGAAGMADFDSCRDAKGDKP